MGMNFYFDESFHDRKITYKNGKVNIHKDDACDSYVAVFIGGDINICHKLEKKYSLFEETQKRMFGLNQEHELKGITIGKKNFKYGLASFNKDAVCFYKEYFSMFSEEVYVQMNILSKTAQVIETIFSEANFSRGMFNKKEFLYSVTKALNNYRFNDILIRLFDEKGSFNNKKLVDSFIRNLKLIIKLSNNSTKKRLERDAYNNLIVMLNEVKGELNTSTKYLFDYEYIFDNFNSYNTENLLVYKQMDLFIDKEVSILKTASENKKYGSVTSCESTECWGVRISDILSNFIGRMVKALSEDLKEPPIHNKNVLNSYDFKTKKLLNTEWFKLNEKQFNLYKVINDVFKIRKNAMYTSYFFDYELLFSEILGYFGEYVSYEKYQNYSIEEHAELFNTTCCRAIAERYNSL
ncbi:hypothetical protein [Paenibacillus borealis]|uniref:DUF3800 domain-containing protein n=1 Tax=Paenibacillus borealis TaxID=160799 RepID=A0A089L6F9_PAEBO|nr:hypothetical protein [Paenibacillus borealis]AIQ55695.1 hypothetical protein PBOR_00955 [Paenibacillus borealis]